MLKKEPAEFVTLSTTVIWEGGGYEHFALWRFLNDGSRQRKIFGTGPADGSLADDAWNTIV